MKWIEQLFPLASPPLSSYLEVLVAPGFQPNDLRVPQCSQAVTPQSGKVKPRGVEMYPGSHRLLERWSPFVP